MDYTLATNSILLALITSSPNYNPLSFFLRHKVLITRLILRCNQIHLHIWRSADQPCLQIISGLLAFEITKYFIKIITYNWLYQLFTDSLPQIILWRLRYMAEWIWWMIITWPRQIRRRHCSHFISSHWERPPSVRLPAASNPPSRTLLLLFLSIYYYKFGFFDTLYFCTIHLIAFVSIF